MSLVRTALDTGMLIADAHGDPHPAPVGVPADGQQLLIASLRIPRVPLHTVLAIGGDLEFTNDLAAAPGALPDRVDAKVDLDVQLSSSPTGGAAADEVDHEVVTLSWREHHFTFTPQVFTSMPPGLRTRPLFVIVLASALPLKPLQPHCAADSFQGKACAVTFNAADNELIVQTLGRRAPVPQVIGTPGVFARSLPAPLAIEPHASQRYTVWHSRPLRLRPGDMLDVAADLQLSARDIVMHENPHASFETGCNVMFSGQLLLSTDAEVPEGPPVPLDADTGFNLTEASPETPWRALGAVIVPPGFENAYVLLRAWSARGTTSRTCADRPLQIEPRSSLVTLLRFPAGDTRRTGAGMLRASSVPRAPLRFARRTNLALPASLCNAHAVMLGGELVIRARRTASVAVSEYLRAGPGAPPIALAPTQRTVVSPQDVSTVAVASPLWTAAQSPAKCGAMLTDVLTAGPQWPITGAHAQHPPAPPPPPLGPAAGWISPQMTVLVWP